MRLRCEKLVEKAGKLSSAGAANDNKEVVLGGGVVEAAISVQVQNFQCISNNNQLFEESTPAVDVNSIIVQSFAEALDEIPLALASNAGMDPLKSLVELKAKHARGRTVLCIANFWKVAALLALT